MRSSQVRPGGREGGREGGEGWVEGVVRSREIWVSF